MAAQEPFTVFLEPNPLECWDEESTASALRPLAVRLHSTGFSLRETAAALREFGVTRSHQAVFQWVYRTAETAPDPPTAKPSWVAVDEIAVKIGTEQHWLYAAIDVETKLLLGAVVSERRVTDPAAEFLGQLAEKHDFSETTFLVDGIRYLTTLARCDATRSPRLRRAKFDRKVVPDARDANRPLPPDLDGRQRQRTALARRLRLLL